MHEDAQVTLITGCSRGIGNFLVRRYLSLGHVVFGCSRSEMNDPPEGLQHLVADITIEDDVKRMFHAIRKRVGRLDNLINNAGIASMNHALLMPGSTAARVISTNYLGTFLVCREGARMLQRSGGRIVNFSSVASALDLDGEAIYASSKAAVESLTRILSKELGAFGITVNAVGPTPVETDLIRSVPVEKIQALISKQAVKRLGTFEDVANVVDFFLSSKSDFISGQVLYLGGVFK